jgi:hypothetical protein
MKKLALATLFILGPVAATLADNGPVGIGFVQAEEGTWWCRAGNAAKAFKCARDKCEAAKDGQECHEMRWCGLAGWSGTMVIWLPEFHSTTILCGAPSETAVTEALKALCANDEVVTRCDLVTLIDPDGKEKLVEGISWPGPTATEQQEEQEPAEEETPTAPPQ